MKKAVWLNILGTLKTCEVSDIDFEILLKLNESIDALVRSGLIKESEQIKVVRNMICSSIVVRGDYEILITL